MGHWGTSILSNDTSADIKDIYFDMFDSGKSISSIREKLKRDFLEGDNISNNTNFWLTMSLLDWQIGDQDEKTKQLAIKIIDEQIDIKVWEESGADKTTLRQRDKVLLELREKILNTNPKPRKPRKKRIPKPIFKKGECFAFPMKIGELEIKGNWTKTYGQFGFTPWQWIIDYANDYLVDKKPRPNIIIKTNKYLNNKRLLTI